MNTKNISISLAIIASVFLITSLVNAATTISTNIETAGTLSVTGLSSLGQASSTMFSAGTAYFGETATTSIGSTGILTFRNSETIDNTTDDVITIGATTLKLIGTASTSALKIGDEAAAPTINGLVHGYCSFANVTLAASSTAGFTACTTVPAGALVAGDRVFVQATSSFESMFIITAASTTGASTIQLRILNTGLGAADDTLSGTSVNFWAVR